MTVRETLTALFNSMLIALAYYGAGMAGMALPEDFEKDFKNTP